MNIYLIEKTNDKRMINLGAKITLERLDKELNLGKTILLRIIDSSFQTDFRLRKVPEVTKLDRGYKKVKSHYLANIEFGREGFDKFFPKEVLNEKNLRFTNLERAINMIEAKQKINRRDWIIEKN